jgi:hypothetical protein
MRRLLMCSIHPRSNPAHSFTAGGTSAHGSISTCAIRYLQNYSFILVSNVTHPRSAHCSRFPLLQSHQPAVRRSACQLLYISSLYGAHVEVVGASVLSAIYSSIDINELTRSLLGSLLLEHRRLSSATAPDGIRTIIMPVPRGTGSSLVSFSLIVIIGNRFLALLIGSHLCFSREWISSIITRCTSYNRQFIHPPRSLMWRRTVVLRPSFVVTSLSWVDSTPFISLRSTPLSLGTVLSWNTRVVGLSLSLTLALELLSITSFS